MDMVSLLIGIYLGSYESGHQDMAITSVLLLKTYSEPSASYSI